MQFQDVVVGDIVLVNKQWIPLEIYKMKPIETKYNVSSNGDSFFSVLFQNKVKNLLVILFLNKKQYQIRDLDLNHKADINSDAKKFLLDKALVKARHFLEEHKLKKNH